MLPWLRVPWGPLQLGDAGLWEEVREEEGEEGKGIGVGCSSEGECLCWVLCLEDFVPLLQAEILGEISEEAFSRLISSPGVLFQGHGLY